MDENTDCGQRLGSDRPVMSEICGNNTQMHKTSTGRSRLLDSVRDLLVWLGKNKDPMEDPTNIV